MLKGNPARKLKIVGIGHPAPALIPNTATNLVLFNNNIKVIILFS